MEEPSKDLGRFSKGLVRSWEEALRRVFEVPSKLPLGIHSLREDLPRVFQDPLVALNIRRRYRIVGRLSVSSQGLTLIGYWLPFFYIVSYNAFFLNPGT